MNNKTNIEEDKREKKYISSNELTKKIKELQVKANAYDALVEKIKDKLVEEKEDMHFAKRDEMVEIHAYTREVLKELLDTEK